MKKILIFLLIMITLMGGLCSCSGEQGPQGDVGPQGQPGKDGIDGEDGHTPEITIGENGNWFIDGVDTGVSAKGEPGGNGESGSQGEPGEKGEDGLTPFIGDNGNWWIGEKDTGYPSKGENGQSTSVAIDENGYWVIDNEVTSFKAEGNIDYLKSLLDSVFECKKDEFICLYETTKKPVWSYTTSTFSGWGGSIGKPENMDAVTINVRARENPITQIKFHLTVNDKSGESIAAEIIDVDIPSGESREITWVLPEKLVNNSNFLYLSYNCNQLCDGYLNTSSEADIPSDEYPAVMTYAVNGKLYDTAANMIDVYQSPCRYLYAKVGLIKDVFVPKDNKFEQTEKINVFLPDEYSLAVNDNFQLFYRGVVQAVNPYNYSITVTCSKGNAYPRYYEWKPTENDIGTYDLKLTVYDNNGKILGFDQTKLKVYSPKENNEVQNVLCIGDSLTSGGYWAREAQRRFNETGGSPGGLGLGYLNFVGSKESYLNSGTVRHEGYAGWTWGTFLGTSSPFYDEELQDISFKSYCERNNIEDLDVVYILLTWNGMGEMYKTDYSLDSGHFKNAQKLLDKLHEEYPNAIVRCMGIQMPCQNGGMGNNYGANGGYSDDYGVLVSAMNYNKTLEDLCKLEKYSSFVKYVDIAGQFDTDYNMPSTNKPVNNRNETTEIIGTNGVHPSIGGYYQIADAVFRSLCEVFSKE